MAAAVRSRLPARRYPLKVIQVMNQYLFEELQFAGNRQNYYEPDNSHLNCVIDRRLGIPITLSLVYLEIAARINFPMVGVGIPGHFFNPSSGRRYGDIRRSVSAGRGDVF